MAQVEQDAFGFRAMNWPFKDRPNIACFTSREIAAGRDWIYYVSHDKESAWQFFPYQGPPEESEATVVSLQTILKIDPTVAPVAD